jgi:hypothetical protein
MTVSSGHLDGLLNHTFPADQVESISIDAVTRTDTDPPALQSVQVSSTGAPISPIGGVTFIVTAVSDTNNQITVTPMLHGVAQPATVYNVIGYLPNGLLISAQPQSTFAAAPRSSYASLASVSAIVATTVVPANTQLTFEADGSFGGTACFAAGTRIRTSRGDITVELLRIGDLVPTQVARGAAPVRWVGRRALDARRQPKPWDNAPVRVRTGAFAPGRPARDLLLSPDHAVMLDRALVPVRYLRNGATIAQERPGPVTYFHVELDAHDVLLAEDLACETYLDTGNRTAFENAPGPIAIVADFSRRAGAAAGCLPLDLDGPLVARWRDGLAGRARALGWRRTDAPDLRATCDGRELSLRRDGNHYAVTVPARARDMVLHSRSVVPAELTLGADGRRLGVALADILRDGAPPPAAAFGAGWHEDEGGVRWTDGEARLAMAGARELRFRLRWTQQYWLAPEMLPVRQAREA